MEVGKSNVPMLRFIDYTIKNYEDIILTKLGLASIYVKTVISDEKTTYQDSMTSVLKEEPRLRLVRFLQIVFSH